MTTIFDECASWSDREVIAAMMRVAGDERRVTAGLLSLLGEFDARRLYLGEGCSSLFAYCTQVVRLSEHAAYHRIEAARAARRFPVILDLIADGAVTLTTVALLRPHLTTGNHEALLIAARYKSKREVEHQIAQIAPQPEAPALVRRLAGGVVERAVVPSAPFFEVLPAIAESTTAAPLAAPLPRPDPPAARTVIAPLAPGRYLLKITISGETHAKLRRAQDLIRHTVPNGDPAAIVDRALTLLVEHLEQTKLATVTRPRAGVDTPSRSRSRHIPASVKRAVWLRDQGRCAYVGPRGRCTETGRLEFHHSVPFARGGPADVANIALRCRAHNRFESEQLFGPWVGHSAPADRRV